MITQSGPGWQLDLTVTKATDAGIKELASLTNLELLDLRNTRVTDTGLRYPNNSRIGLPVVRERKMPLASCGLLIGMSSAW
jgi:hypothetical protein